MNRRHMILSLGGGLAAASLSASAAPATLPKLPYAFDALEPYIDARTMEIHHGRHHQAYVDNLNKAIGGDPKLNSLSIEDLLGKLDTVPEAIRTAVRNNGGGHANHSLFWQVLAPAKGQAPKGKLVAALDKTFGSQAAFEDKLRATAQGQFGSGWAWLSLNAKNELLLEGYPNQDGPLMRQQRPLLGIDVWEHAYYLKYQNKRADYLAAVTKVINWDFVSERYEALAK
ncbi:MAG: superoxide dismutase [Acidobacteria bacterium]|nr:superoxide dismutase [Acidobacteriota bacterium]